MLVQISAVWSECFGALVALNSDMKRVLLLLIFAVNNVAVTSYIFETPEVARQGKNLLFSCLFFLSNACTIDSFGAWVTFPRIAKAGNSKFAQGSCILIFFFGYPCRGFFHSILWWPLILPLHLQYLKPTSPNRCKLVTLLRITENSVFPSKRSISISVDKIV